MEVVIFIKRKKYVWELDFLHGFRVTCIITGADGCSRTYVGLLVFLSFIPYNTRHFGGLDIRREWSIGWCGECPDKLNTRVTPWLYFSWTLSSSVSHVSPSHLATFQIFASYHVVVSLGVGTAHYDLKALKTLDSSLTSWPFFISWPGRWGGQTTSFPGSSHFWVPHLMDFSDPCEGHRHVPRKYAPQLCIFNYAVSFFVLRLKKCDWFWIKISGRFAGELEFSWFVSRML